eukprot:TRINITY_DN3693_c0_g1_i1.p1 TRINITY_DN3693_c0_g1~~TRINITY_DN3693_c0_g1_i1.p1  ORF type:complete len:169 (-),score=27.60 TRINITY_DN3693_c0_g1_i1:27-533(-)
MPEYIGSWMGDCFGMMQWPMSGEFYMELLRNIITENNVGMIIALGGQDPNARAEMVSYWETLGTDFKQKSIDHFIIREITGIRPNDNNCSAYQYLSWPDKTSPTESKTDFDILFREIELHEKAGKKILIHCRAGVGRSGTLRLMYKAWKREFNIQGLVSAFNAQWPLV